MKKGSRKKRVLLAAVLFLLPLNAPAQESTPAPVFAAADEMLLFQDIPSVVGASKYEQKVTEAPSAVSIVTSSEIKKYGYRTLSDILRSVRSFYVTYDRNYSYVGVRGFGRPGDYNSRILLLIDGHRTNDNIYDQALIGTEGILDVDLIDRVEVIRGPGSSLYGSNAFFAVVNIITKRGRDLKGAEISGEAGRFQTEKGRVSYGDRFTNGVEAIISGSAYDSKGQRLFYPEYDSPATNNGITDHADYDRFQSFFSKISHHDLTLSGAYLSRTKGIPTGAFDTDFNDPGNKTKDERAYLDLKYERSLSSRKDIAARFYYDLYRYEGDYRYYQDGDPATGLNKDLGSGDWWGGEVKLTQRIAGKHRLILGTEYQGNLRQDQKNYDADPVNMLLDDARRSRNWAIYAQDEITLSAKVMLNAGVRHDHYATFSGMTSPRLAFIYTPVEKSVIKLLYGSAFRVPNTFELYYDSDTNDPNPALKPEKIETYELVYEQYLGERFRASVAGYHYRIKDLINQTEPTPGVTVFQNVDDVSAHGAELELDNKWAGGIEGRISYTLQRTRDLLTGEPLTNSPSRLAKLNVTVPVVAGKVFAAIEEQYRSRRRTEAGSYTNDFVITNLTLSSQQVIDRMEVSASVYNLFDRHYGDPVSSDLAQDTVQQDGRNFRVKLVYAF